MRMHPLPCACIPSHTPHCPHQSVPFLVCCPVCGTGKHALWRGGECIGHVPEGAGVHVCMCVCVHVCMCACVHVCMCIGHVPEGAGTSPPLLGAPPRRVQRHTCTCTHAHMHTCTHAHMRTCTHAHMHTCAHTHMRTYMHIQTHAHAHTRMRTCVCVQVPRRTRSRRSAAPS